MHQQPSRKTHSKTQRLSQHALNSHSQGRRKAVFLLRENWFQTKSLGLRARSAHEQGNQERRDEMQKTPTPGTPNTDKHRRETEIKTETALNSKGTEIIKLIQFQ